MSLSLAMMLYRPQHCVWVCLLADLWGGGISGSDGLLKRKTVYQANRGNTKANGRTVFNMSNEGACRGDIGSIARLHLIQRLQTDDPLCAWVPQARS